MDPSQVKSKALPSCLSIAYDLTNNNCRYWDRLHPFNGLAARRVNTTSVALAWE